MSFEAAEATALRLAVQFGGVGALLDLLRGSVQDYGQTLVMVTHDARAAATADRILFIADGVIVKELHGADEHQVLAAVEEITLR